MPEIIISLEYQKIINAFIFINRSSFLSDLESQDNTKSIVTQFENSIPQISSTPIPVMLRMLNALEIKEGDRVLEIGTGTGYNAAIISKIIGPHGQLVSIEPNETAAELARNRLIVNNIDTVEIINSNVYDWTTNKKFNKIIITCDVSTIPNNIVECLVLNGKLVVPFSFIYSFTKKKDSFVGFPICQASFISAKPIPVGAHFWQCINETLFIYYKKCINIDILFRQPFTIIDNNTSLKDNEVECFHHFIRIEHPQIYIKVQNYLLPDKTKYNGFGIVEEDTGTISLILIDRKLQSNIYFIATIGRNYSMSLVTLMEKWNSTDEKKLDHYKVKLINKNNNWVLKGNEEW